MSIARTPTKQLDRLPPQNLDAERCVLGSVLLWNEAIDEVADFLLAEHFYSDAHRRIYTAIRRMYERGVHAIDPVTLAEELDKHGEMESVGGTDYLVQLLDSVPHAANAEYYARIVRDKSIQRQLIFACNEILGDCYDSGREPDEILSAAEQRVFRILEDQGQSDKLTIGDILFETFDRINKRLEQEGAISGLPSGYNDLDRQINGFQASELIVVASRPSMGKTALVCNIAESMAMEYKTPVLMFSLEQSAVELAERFLCIRSGVNGHRVKGGELNADERERLMKASSELSDAPLYLDDRPGRTISQIAAISRRLKRRQNVGLVMIDYLQLIEPENRSAPREQQIAVITRRLKFLAKELDLPVIALAQLNRGVEHREDKRPRLSDLRESGAIEQDADVVMFLHRAEQYDPDDRPGEADIIVAKNRNGPTGLVRLTWISESMRFTNFSGLEEPDGGFFAETDESY